MLKEKGLKMLEDLGIYTDIYDTGKKYKNTGKHLYHAKCKICGTEVEKLLFQIRKSKQCQHQKKHFLNNYVDLFLPEHHLARKNGYVYEHLIIAEQILNRELISGETVHHKDKNRNNNSPENLMVFKTNADHARFHKTGIAIKEGDVYISPRKIPRCIDCGKEIDYKATRCVECYRNNQRKNIPSKEELNELIRNKSFVQIGEDYGVTDSAVRKWCKSYNLPFRKKDL